jgi:hypothetical protein
MNYILEINHINPRKNMFFYESNTATVAQAEEFHKPLLKKHFALGTWGEQNGWMLRKRTIIQRPNGEWQSILRIPGFVSVKHAHDFFKDLIADGTEFRRLLRQWHADNNILNETNILDEQGNIVDVVHACQSHKCSRFGGCPTDGTGCNRVPLLNTLQEYPVYHLQAITNS